MHCVSVGGGVHVTHRCRGDRVGAGLRLKRSRLSCRSRLSLLSRLQGCGVVDVSVVVRSSLGWAGVFGGDGDGGMQGSAHSSSVMVVGVFGGDGDGGMQGSAHNSSGVAGSLVMAGVVVACRSRAHVSLAASFTAFASATMPLQSISNFACRSA